MGDDFGAVRSESKSREKVVLPLASAIKNSALHFILAIEDYLQITAVEGGAHSSVVKFGNIFCPSRARWKALLGHVSYGDSRK